MKARRWLVLGLPPYTIGMGRNRRPSRQFGYKSESQGTQGRTLNGAVAFRSEASACGAS